MELLERTRFDGSNGAIGKDSGLYRSIEARHVSSLTCTV